jgi:NodT family efflux transporter outer membrane factor (OMF) lipoprotein
MAVLVAATGILMACGIGPAYIPPVVEPGPAFQEVPSGPTTEETWKVAKPSDELPRGPWWEQFGDAELDALETRADVSSQAVLEAAARFRQARAALREDRSAYFPKVTTSPALTEQRPSDNRSIQPVSRSGRITDFALPVDVTYEPDLWGRVNQAVAGGRANAQAVAADLENVRLSVHAEVAADYLQLRALDADADLLHTSVASFERALDLTRNRYQAGVASNGDVAQAEAQLETTRAQVVDVGILRAQLEHAIAALIGEIPSEFSIPRTPLDGEPPTVPVGLPSELLQRRPDIAAAERRVAAANAQLGVARTAFFPSLMLSVSAGLESSSLADWLAWPSRFWALGATLTQTLFDAGARRAASDQARAAYDATVAEYRESVLAAFQDIEDNLAALRVLNEEARTQAAAVDAAQRSLDISTNQYRAGLVSYLQVVTAQTAALTNRRAALNTLERRFVASVQLVKALGGGWDVSMLSD